MEGIEDDVISFRINCLIIRLIYAFDCRFADESLFKTIVIRCTPELWMSCSWAYGISYDSSGVALCAWCSRALRWWSCLANAAMSHPYLFPTGQTIPIGFWFVIGSSFYAILNLSLYLWWVWARSWTPKSRAGWPREGCSSSFTILILSAYCVHLVTYLLN